MPHSITKTGAEVDMSYFERLWGVLLHPGLDLGTKLTRLFEMETAEFGVDHAFLSRIDPEAGTERFEVVYGPYAERAQTTISLSDSYCRKTIREPSGTLVVNDAAEEGWKGDPAYETLNLGSYLGTTVTADDELYGTLCFANTGPRGEPFAEEEVALVEIHGQWATYELNQWSGPPTHPTPDGDVDLQQTSSEDIDEMLDVLAQRARRLVLLAILEESAEDVVDVVSGVLDAGNVEVQLYHSHFPKLEQAGYIEWDRDSNTVTEGPKFSEVEPLLRLLREYTSEFPR